MREIAKNLHKQGLRWVYLNGPGHTIWVQRSDRLMTLLTLGKMGYRQGSEGRDISENNSVLILSASTQSTHKIRVITDLHDFDLQSQESAFWDRKIYSYVSAYGVVLPQLSVSDRFIFHLAALKNQTEKTMELWLDHCKQMLNDSGLTWKTMLPVLVSSKASGRLMKAVELASSWGVLFPNEILSFQKRPKSKENSLDSPIGV